MKRFLSILSVSSILGFGCLSSFATTVDCHQLVSEWKKEVQDLSIPSPNDPNKKVTINYEGYKITSVNCPDPGKRSLEWNKKAKDHPDVHCEIHAKDNTSCMCMTSYENKDDPKTKMFIYCEPK